MDGEFSPAGLAANPVDVITRNIASTQHVNLNFNFILYSFYYFIFKRLKPYTICKFVATLRTNKISSVQEKQSRLFG